MAINVTATHVFEEKVVFHAYLSDGKGVDTNTAVKVSGIEAGRVLSLNITENNKVHVEMFVYEDFHDRIRSNALATLNRLSMLGVVSIDINPGTIDSPVLADGATIDMRETLSVDQLMEGVAELLYRADAGRNETLFANLAETAANINVITTQIAEGKGAAGTLLYDEEFNSRMVNSVDSLHQLIASASARLEQMDPLLVQSNEVVASLRDVTAELPALLTEVRKSVTEARQLLTIMSGEMEALPDFMVRADLLIQDADALIDALEKIWPVSSALQRPQDNALVKPQVAHD